MKEIILKKFNLFKYNNEKDLLSSLSIDTKLIERLSKKDPSLWIKDSKPGDDIPDVTNRLGWLDLPEQMKSEIDGINKIADDIKSAGFEDIVLLGMGGSSLAPQMFMLIFENEEGYPPLTVLDSTHPETILGLISDLNLEKTLFIVSSKSGSTIETLSFYKFFYELIKNIKENPGENFIAITDLDSKLEKDAEEHKFRYIINANPEVGGRFSALSHFGMVPAGLIAIDLNRLLTIAEEGMKTFLDGKNNNVMSPLVLSSVIGDLWKTGNSRVQFILSEELQSFGDWVEQLIAESLGKEGEGILPLSDSIIDCKVFDDESLYILMRLKEEDQDQFDKLENELTTEGKNFISLEIENKYAIAIEIVRWGITTALLGSYMKLNPFDQPNVESAKVKARQLMEQYQKTKTIPDKKHLCKNEYVRVFSEDISSNNPENSLNEFLKLKENSKYISLMAYLPYEAELFESLDDIRIKIQEKTGLPVTLGFGPRFLHSTGQMHKGDDNSGLFIQFTNDITEDLEVPGEEFSFGVLVKSQALGDYEALKDEGRKVLRFHLSGDPNNGLEFVLKSL